MPNQQFPSSPSTVLSDEERARIEKARRDIRQVELFSLRIVSDESEEELVRRAKEIRRLAVGLRRLLDRWKE